MLLLSETPTLGPIGLVTKNRIFILAGTFRNKATGHFRVDGTIPIVKAYAGMQGDLLEAIAHTKVDGLVIEAFRCGESPSTSLSCFGKASCPKNPCSTCFSLFQWNRRACL